MSRIPDEFICPISQSVMTKPTTLPCGHTFDEENLKNWILVNPMCPTCRHAVNENNLYTNWSLKSLIEKYNNDSLDQQSQAEEILIDESVEEIELNDSILKNIQATVSSKKNLIDLSLNIPELNKRRPVSFVCVIDVSGSMQDTVGNAEGGKAFTRLDLVKHVLNVIIASLTESDRLALIAFSDNPEVILDLVPLNKSNKRLAKQYVASLTPLASTYTGPALRKAYELIKKAPKSHVQSIILLTDGQDTDGSEILEKTFDLIKKPDQVQLNTFGFSNNIVSDCLARLATKGNGIFGFIPDQSMIGTIFINFLANTFLTYIQKLHISISDNCEFVNEADVSKTTMIQFGKKHHFLIIKKREFDFDGTLTVKIGFTKDNLIKIKTSEEKLNEHDFNLLKCRDRMLEILTSAKLPILNLDTYESKFKIAEFLAEIKQTENPDPNNEQIALSMKFWNTWGAHYVRSFQFSHLFEQAINFKSPSMKFYRTPRFDEYIDKLTETFITLPPPKASAQAHANAPQIRMQNIMNRNNGCILSTCDVKLKSGGYKKIEHLKKDDILANGSKVVCVIKSIYDGNLIRINNLIITPYHPVFYEEKWQFPADIYLNKLSNSNEISRDLIELIENEKPISVCNLVLDSKHYAKIEGLNCITLAHGYTQDPVLRHAYYGTNKCVQDLMSLKGWNEGFININTFNVTRDESGLVSSINELEVQ